MLGLLITIRNFTIALMLAWMGFSLAPDSDNEKEANNASPNTGAFSLFAG